MCVELKREASRDLFTKRPRGRLSPEQKAFKQRCFDAGVGYLVAYCWEDVECCLGGCAARSGIAAAKARGKRLGRQPGQRPKSDRLAPQVLALVAKGRSYRLIRREVGLSKNTVAEIVKRRRTRRLRLHNRYFAPDDTNVGSGPSSTAVAGLTHCALTVNFRTDAASRPISKIINYLS